jgi:hypothetical protein
MKKLLILATVILLTYGSCKEISQLSHFYIDYKNDITIPPVIYVGTPYDIWTPYIPTNSDELFSKNNTSSSLIEEILLTELNMDITSPSSQSFDFLQSIDIYISSDSVTETKIAWNNDIPKTGLSTVKLETSPDDLQNFIKKPVYSLRCRLIVRDQISDSTNIEILSTFFVDAKLAGI